MYNKNIFLLCLGIFRICASLADGGSHWLWRLCWVLKELRLVLDENGISAINSELLLKGIPSPKHKMLLLLHSLGWWSSTQGLPADAGKCLSSPRSILMWRNMFVTFYLFLKIPFCFRKTKRRKIFAKFVASLNEIAFPHSAGCIGVAQPSSALRIRNQKGSV